MLMVDCKTHMSAIVFYYPEYRNNSYKISSIEKVDVATLQTSYNVHGNLTLILV